ncbi:alkaline phosphatase [Oleiphilus messinensis]|uniref:Alkaline phosphatase n=1 Tax=Oleiphilus messinensis TaxID=141451 RepID=A0A1Y0I7N0_9GAMM|nr:alkaline phosphatase [Oleiphilus messinensis]ARU55766.1 alkaline phosphatase [Oleiphilus messinensis]
MNKKLLATALAAAMTLGVTGCGDDDDDNSSTPNTPQRDMSAANSWIEAGEKAVAEAAKRTVNNNRGAAKNIILFVGDGMGVSTVTAARILDGQLKGGTGEENLLSFDRFPYTGLSKTYNTNQQTPDSAGTMTAMMSGVKTKAGVIGVAEGVVRADCESTKGLELMTAIELAEMAGKATGVVSTARITHATPAATYAKSPERNWEDVSDMPPEAVAAGCKDIAAQLVEFSYGDGIDVMMGGGRRHFIPKDAAFDTGDGGSPEGDRTDGRNLPQEWVDATGGTYVVDQAGFDAVNAEQTNKLFGLFNESHMRYEADRANDILGEPSLSEMTEKAINILNNDSDGFFLMVESGRIDHGHHAGSAYNALTDTIEFANAVQKAKDLTNDEDTLIIVTADHSHVFTIAGYPTRGNPILGKVVTNDSNGLAKSEPALAGDDLPYTTLGYTNGLGYADLGAETDGDVRYNSAADAGRKDLTTIDTQSPGYHQEALVPMGSETHAGEDVGIYATGPGAHLLTGTVEQNLIYHVMNYAGNLENK